MRSTLIQGTQACVPSPQRNIRLDIQAIQYNISLDMMIKEFDIEEGKSQNVSKSRIIPQLSPT